MGDGEERPICENAAGQKLEWRKVFVLSASNQKDCPGRNAADVVVMTSLYEGHALVPLSDGLLAGGRSFFTDGITDSVQNGQTGLLCEIGDVAALGKSIAQLLRNDEERITFGRNGRRLVEEKISANEDGLSLSLSAQRTADRQIT